VNDRTPDRAFSNSPDWWGPRWITRSGGRDQDRRGDLGMLDLIDAGTVDLSVAALLWELVARRSSIVVIAGPSGAGKTTLLTALTDFLPPEELLLPVRGVFDPLSFLEVPTIDPDETTVMVNEISPHLPVYLWGPSVERLLTSRRRFRVFATAHASSARDLVAQLAGFPLRVPLAGVARLGVAVRIEAWRDAGDIRRAVTEVTAFDRSDRDGIVLRPLLAHGTTTVDDVAVRTWLGEATGRGDRASIAMRHNLLSDRRSLNESLVGSDRSLRAVFAAAIARALGDT
jgi:energy-coupling factor transporter ATP-binding protein EcfA2